MERSGTEWNMMLSVAIGCLPTPLPVGQPDLGLGGCLFVPGARPSSTAGRRCTPVLIASVWRRVVRCAGTGSWVVVRLVEIVHRSLTPGYVLGPDFAHRVPSGVKFWSLQLLSWMYWLGRGYLWGWSPDAGQRRHSVVRDV